MKRLSLPLKALSDETRLRILALLSMGELCVCDLIAVLCIPQSTISRHLAYLRDAGLIADRRHGKWMFYRLTLSNIVLHREIAAIVARLQDFTTIQADRKALQLYLKDKTESACR
ncbi:ArsR/SmtB family transcription factor [Thermodesulfobacteriota bacterium]